MKRTIVIIPTYNERDGIAAIVTDVTTRYPDVEVWVVDDNSPDGTAAAVADIAKINPSVKLISRSAKTGLGDAYKETLIQIQKMDDVHSVVTMDADGSHNPAKVRELLDALADVDLAVGSRYVKGGGGMKGMGMYRNFLSRGGNLYARIIIGFGLHDSTAGFVAFRKSALDDIDISAIASSGYSYQIEFKNALLEAGRSFREIPITFIDREIGTSKMSGKIILEGMLSPWRIAARKTFSPSYFLGTLRMALLSFLVLLTVFFSLYRLTESPPVWYDEGIYIQTAANLTNYGVAGLRLSPVNVSHVSKVSVGYPLTHPLAGVFSLFGATIVSARLLMVLYILGLVAASYFLVRRLWSPSIALLSFALLATFPPLYGNGKSVLGEVPGLLLIFTGLLLLHFARTTSVVKRKYVVGAGLFFGLAVAMKPVFLLLLPALVGGLLLQWRKIQFKPSTLVFGVLATLAPLVLWFLLQFQSGDSLLDILSYYANPYHFQNLTAVIIANSKNFFTAVGPLYLLLMMFVWLASLAVRLKRKTEISLEETISFLLSVLCMLAYLRTSGEFRYLFVPQVISVVFFPPALVLLARLYVRRISTLFLVSAFSVLVIFGVYQLCFDSWVADAYNSTKTASWERYFEQLPPATSVFFYDTPEVAMFMKGTNYYQYIQPVVNIRIGTEQLYALQKGLPNEVIVVTDILKSLDPKLFDHYRLSKQFYKYSILNKI